MVYYDVVYRSRLAREVDATLHSCRLSSTRDCTTTFWLSPTSATTALSRHARISFLSLQWRVWFIMIGLLIVLSTTSLLCWHHSMTATIA